MGRGCGANDVTHRVVITSFRSVTWSLCRWVRNTACRAPALVPAAAARIRTPRPQSKSRSPRSVLTSVAGPARSGSGSGLPLPSTTTCTFDLESLGWPRPEHKASVAGAEGGNQWSGPSVVTVVSLEVVVLALVASGFTALA